MPFFLRVSVICINSFFSLNDHSIHINLPVCYPYKETCDYTFIVITFSFPLCLSSMICKSKNPLSLFLLFVCLCYLNYVCFFINRVELIYVLVQHFFFMYSYGCLIRLRCAWLRYYWLRKKTLWANEWLCNQSVK